MTIKRSVNQLLSKVFQLGFVKQFWARRFESLSFDEIPWQPFDKELKDCRVGLVTTAGLHLKDDEAFDMKDPDGDPSWRKVPMSAKQQDLKITHDYYDHKDADKDVDVIVPMSAVQQAVKDEKIKSVSDHLISFMGHIDGRHVSRLIKKTRQVVDYFKAQKVDLVLLSPA